MVKNNFKELHRSPKSKLLSVLPPALLIVLNIFLFGTATIYQGNSSTFGINLIEIVKLYIYPIIISLLLLLVVGIFLSKKYLSLYISLIFIAGLSLWMQGNILVWQYGVLDGTGIEWSKYSWQGWVDAGVWTTMLLAAIIFHGKISRISSFASLALIFLQSVFLISTYFSAPQKWESHFSVTESHRVPENLSDYSQSFNVIHIILDTFQTDIFEEILKENKMGPDLDGFVLFRENMGVASLTFLSIPAIFRGEVYQGDINVEASSFINESMTEKGFPNILLNNGYEINLIHQSAIPSITTPPKNVTAYYRIPHVYGGTKKEKYLNEAATLMDLILFRHVPHFLKKRIYNNQAWIIQSFVTTKKLGHFNYKDFFQDYIENVKVKSSRPAYHFIHLIPPHPPVVTDENCEYAGRVFPTNRDTYKIEARCMLRMFIHFIGKLKTLGIYDSSLIILQADTGKGFQVTMNDQPSPEMKSKISNRVVGKALALLVIKPRDNKGPITISDAKTMNTDMPATIMKIAGLKHHFKGINVFEIDPSEERERLFNNTFKVTGSVYDYKSWKRIARPQAYKQTAIKPYEWGSAINFGFLGNAQFYQTKGWSYLEDGYVWTIKENASLTIPFNALPEASLITLKANLRAFLYSKKINKQTVHILINGKKAGTWVITRPGFRTKTLLLPKKLLDDHNNVVITFNTPNLIFPADVGLINDRRGLGIALRSIVLRDPPVYEWGSVIRFGKEGNSQLYQNDGWSYPEKGFTWTDGQNASLSILVKAVPTSPMILEANLDAFLYPNKIDKQTIDILVNGKEAGTWVITKRGFQTKTLSLPRKLLAGTNHLVITFNTLDATPPANVGYNKDNRLLGIAVHTIKLTK